MSDFFRRGKKLQVLISFGHHTHRCTRVGYRNPVLIWHRYLCNRYVLEPNPNADFGAMPERSVEIFVLCFSEIDVKSIITGTAREKLFILNLCSNVNVLYSHSDLKAQLRK